MDIHMIVKLKSSHEAWHELFAKEAESCSKLCDESRPLFGKSDDTTTLVTLFNVDMEAIGTMMKDPEFHKLTADYVVEHIPHAITPLTPPA